MKDVRNRRPVDINPPYFYLSRGRWGVGGDGMNTSHVGTVAIYPWMFIRHASTVAEVHLLPRPRPLPLPLPSAPRARSRCRWKTLSYTDDAVAQSCGR